MTKLEKRLFCNEINEEVVLDTKLNESLTVTEKSNVTGAVISATAGFTQWVCRKPELCHSPSNCKYQ